MDNDLKISIIIPIKDHTDLLEKLLASITENAPADIGFEIIVVDDGSQDDLTSIIENYNVCYHREENSKGPACARNIGARMASAPLFFFFDADLEYPPGLMEHALHILEKEPELAAISFIDKPYRTGDGIIKNYGSLIEYHFYQIMVDGKPLSRVQMFTTRNGLIRADAFWETGGFDERYTTNAMEDYDFGKRLAAKYPVVMSNGPLIYHNFPEKISGLLRNYWVRARLFIPFYLERRPKLDRAMVSKNEGLLRILGFASVGFLGCGLFLLYFLLLPALFFCAVGTACLLAYIFCLKDFFKIVFYNSGSCIVVLQCLGIHLLSSIVIVLGAFYGLCNWLFIRFGKRQQRNAVGDR